MNGLLSTLSGTAIENPSMMPAFGTGIGSWPYKGRAFTNPALRCNSTANAPENRFNPGGAPQSVAVPSGVNSSAFFGYGAGWRPWIYGKDEKGGGVLISRFDTSAVTNMFANVNPATRGFGY